MNELPSDEVECNMIDDEFEQNIQARIKALRQELRHFIKALY